MVAQALSEQANLGVSPIYDQTKDLLQIQECVGLDQTKFGDDCQRGSHTRKKPSGYGSFSPFPHLFILLSCILPHLTKILSLYQSIHICRHLKSGNFIFLFLRQGVSI